MIVAQPQQGLLRSRRVITIKLPDRGYEYTRAGLGSDVIRRQDGSLVTRLPGVFTKGRLAVGADDVDVATVAVINRSTLGYELRVRV